MARNGNNGNTNGGNNNGKPQKRDYYKLIVVGPNGTLVDEKEWSKQVNPNQDEKELRNQLKKAGFTPVRQFQQKEFDAARDDYKNQTRNRGQQGRKTLIAQAFQDADVAPHSQVERALNIIVPLLDGENDKRVANTLRNIVRSIDSVMSDDGRSKHKAKDGDNGSQGNGQNRRASDRQGDNGDNSGTDGVRSKDKEDSQGNFVGKNNNDGGQQARRSDDNQDDGKGRPNMDKVREMNQTGGTDGSSDEQVELLAKLKAEYDGEADQALSDQDLDRAAEVKQLYDDAVECVMSGDTSVTSIFGNGGRGKSGDNDGGQQASDGRGQAKDPEEDGRRRPGGNNPQGINNSDGTSEGSENGMRALEENRAEGGRNGGGNNGGNRSDDGRGRSGEGGEAENGQKLRKDGEPDQRTKGVDQEEAPGQQTRRENGNQGSSANQ